MPYEEQFSDFGDSLVIARRLVREHQCEVTIRRCSDGWVVSAGNLEYEEVCLDDYEEESDEDGDAERELIESDLMGDDDNLSRSEEDGWYYED